MSLPSPTKKQAQIIWIAVTGLALAVIVALIVATVWGMGRVLDVLSPVIWPVAVAGVLAYLLDPVVDFLKSKGVPRTRAIVLVFVFALLLVLGLLGSIVPQLVIESRELGRKIPTYAENLEKQAEALVNHPPKWLQWAQRFLPGQTVDQRSVGTNAPPVLPGNSSSGTNQPAPPPPVNPPPPHENNLNQTALASATDWLAHTLPTIGKTFTQFIGYIGSWFGIVAGLALVPIYAFYFLLEKRGIESKWTDYLPVQESKFKDELVFVLTAMNEYLIAFFRGQVLVAICDGVFYTIGFVLIGLPYAMLLGAVATVITIIPFLGAIITFIAALIIAFVSFGDWQHPALVLAVFVVVQSLEGFVVQPQIMGDRVGLHPVTIIIALMVGTTLLGGILGGILAIPFTAALRVIMFRYVWKRPEPAKK